MRRRIRKVRSKEQMVTIFAHGKRSMESLLQGKIETLKRHPDPVFQEFIHSAIRILGERFRIEGQESKYKVSGFPRQLHKYAKALFGKETKDKMDELGRCLLEWRIVKNINELVISGDQLQFYPVS